MSTEDVSDMKLNTKKSTKKQIENADKKRKLQMKKPKIKFGVTPIDWFDKPPNFGFGWTVQHFFNLNNIIPIPHSDFFFWTEEHFKIKICPKELTKAVEIAREVKY